MGIPHQQNTPENCMVSIFTNYFALLQCIHPITSSPFNLLSDGKKVHIRYQGSKILMSGDLHLGTAFDHSAALKREITVHNW